MRPQAQGRRSRCNIGDAGELWTPSEITTRLWLEASDSANITLDGSSNVEQWDDLSGNDLHATQTTASSRGSILSAELNGLDVVNLDLACMNIGSVSSFNFLHQSQGCVYAVCQYELTANPGTNSHLMGNNGTASGNVGSLFAYDDRASQSANNRPWCQVSNSSGPNFSLVTNSSYDALIPAAQFNIIGHHYDAANDTASERLAVNVNGGTDVKANTSSTAPSGSNATYIMQIGAPGGFSVGTKRIRIAELVVTDFLLTTTGKEKIQGYLAWKWGLQSLLPVSHPYYSAAP